MTDDIVTRLREGENWHRNGYVEVPSGFYEFLATEIERERKEAADEIERLRKIIKDLHHHLGEALYSDEWDTREYAIASYSRYEGEPF